MSGIFSSLGPFSQDFGQVKEWDILELHEMIRMWHVIAFMTIFILLSGQGQQRGELKRMKNGHFKYFFTVWVIVTMSLGSLRRGLY